MIVGKKEVSAEDQARAMKLVEERTKQTYTRFASASFVDRMTSASADPDAAEAEAAAAGSEKAEDKPDDPDMVFRP